MKEKLTQERLKELLHYNPRTGVFVWIKQRQRIAVGSVAGCIKGDGYSVIKVDDIDYYAQRLAWLYMEGYFPTGIDIDHIDQIKINNWWNNLRLISRQCNTRNSKTPNRNTSGIKGVSWDKKSKKWYARIGINGNDKYLGQYNNFENAVCARLAGEQCVGWSGCDLNSPAFQYVQNNIFIGGSDGKTN